MMFLDVAGMKIPAKWAICDRCRGNGTHGNPAFDGMPVEITPDNDIEFWDDLRAGHYDVRCAECSGSGKVKVIDEEIASADEVKEYNDYLNDKAEYAAEQRAEMLAQYGPNW